MTTILSIESSCDETGAAIVIDGTIMKSNVVATQIKSHKRFGGIVPEIASRHHVEAITRVIEKAMDEADTTWDDVDAIAVTKGPGLVGALLVGVTAAKSLAFAHKKPLIGVDHIEGHIYANNLIQPIEFPAMSLVVSGGHTELVYMPEKGKYQLVGDTRDDAVGEAYDKVGRVLGVPYPGGKTLDEWAQVGEDTYHYPRPMLSEDEYGYDFSFSGLKSAVLNHLHNAEQRGEEIIKENVAASFQAAVDDVLVTKTMDALDEYPAKQLLLAGGVAANTGLRRSLKEALKERHEEMELCVPPIKLCGDNGAMIGAAAYEQYLRGEFSDELMDADPGLEIAE